MHCGGGQCGNKFRVQVLGFVCTAVVASVPTRPLRFPRGAIGVEVEHQTVASDLHSGNVLYGPFSTVIKSSRRLRV
jgi:hypothetical protein